MMVYQPIKIWGEKEDNGSPVNLEGDIQYCSKFKDTGNLCGTTGMVYSFEINFFFFPLISFSFIICQSL